MKFNPTDHETRRTTTVFFPSFPAAACTDMRDNLDRIFRVEWVDIHHGYVGRDGEAVDEFVSTQYWGYRVDKFPADRVVRQFEPHKKDKLTVDVWLLAYLAEKGLRYDG